MNINQRVMFIIDKVAVSKAAFSKQTGISAVILFHINSGRNKVSLSTVEAILKAYPNVSAEYLILGVGNHFKLDELAQKEEILAKIRQTQAQLDLQHAQSKRQIQSLIDHINGNAT